MVNTHSYGGALCVKDINTMQNYKKDWNFKIYLAFDGCELPSNLYL